MSSFEEKYLMSFFPEYEEYRKHTYIMIPFLPNSKSYSLCSTNDWLVFLNNKTEPKTRCGIF